MISILPSPSTFYVYYLKNRYSLTAFRRPLALTTILITCPSTCPLQLRTRDTVLLLWAKIRGETWMPWCRVHALGRWRVDGFVMMNCKVLDPMTSSEGQRLYWRELAGTNSLIEARGCKTWDFFIIYHGFSIAMYWNNYCRLLSLPLRKGIANNELETRTKGRPQEGWCKKDNI